MSGPGLVSLVGAGPGDPELLTLRAVARLGAADVVFYDALVDRAALRYAPRARWAYVGKRAFRPSISQATIQGLMIRRALRGERVVRLKSGDPFVFGRGGEEALALAAAGIPCEVVPGVSAAVAAPALSGIPVTHRGLSAAFLVVSGHSEAAFAPVLGSLEPGTATVVVLMGLQTRALVADQLLSRGWAPGTPAAVLLAAGTSDARTWRGTLATLGACELPDQSPNLPGVLVVGASVAVAAQLEALGGPRQREDGPLGAAASD
ncbi:MAG TPA: uroporphyrinogen-III C-methyltransferase [Myxococcaceae bacterium]|nr:uroporphyrinogen-III C-methyltransferase [Myxococcaceae bacterium]